mmetsp:Transcript_18747/g.52177  ORF Transcript_18747/g.52177 Transcript_18747/m.52177 type:complete len:256 (-) Transcript_18747:1828-2595(-)
MAAVCCPGMAAAADDFRNPSTAATSRTWASRLAALQAFCMHLTTCEKSSSVHAGRALVPCSGWFEMGAGRQSSSAEAPSAVVSAGSCPRSRQKVATCWSEWEDRAQGCRSASRRPRWAAIREAWPECPARVARHSRQPSTAAQCEAFSSPCRRAAEPLARSRTDSNARSSASSDGPQQASSACASCRASVRIEESLLIATASFSRIWRRLRRYRGFSASWGPAPCAKEASTARVGAILEWSMAGPGTRKGSRMDR